MAPQSDSEDALNVAREELEAAVDEAGGNVDGDALAVAEQLIDWICRGHEQAPMVDPSDDGGISLDFRNEDQGSAVLICCEPQKAVAVYVFDGTVSDRGRFTKPGRLMRGFVEASLEVAGIR